jgi:hypothetical protein
MTSQVIVPHRPGPVVDVPDAGPGGPAEPLDGGIGTPEIALTVGGGALLAAVPLAGLASWLSVVAVACLALGVALPAHGALLRAIRRQAEQRRAAVMSRGTVLDVSTPSCRRLVAAYRRLERTAGRQTGMGMGLARDAGHLALTEVAGLLRGRPPEHADEEEYIACRAEAISALADRLADGPVMPAELAGADSLARIKALLA